MDTPAWVQTLLDGNGRYVAQSTAEQHASLAGAPQEGLAIVACMDTRHVVEAVFDIKPGKSVVIRGAGPVVDAGVLRSLKVAVHALGVERVVLMGHSDCGMTKIAHMEDLEARVAKRGSGRLAPEAVAGYAARLGAFADPVGNVDAGLEVLCADPELPNDLEVVGMLYDNATGKVSVVAGPMSLSALSAA